MGRFIKSIAENITIKEDDIDKDRYFKKSQFTLIHCDTEDPIEVDGSKL